MVILGIYKIGEAILGSVFRLSLISSHPPSRTRQALPTGFALACAYLPPSTICTDSSRDAPLPYSAGNRQHRQQQPHLELLRDTVSLNSHRRSGTAGLHNIPRVGTPNNTVIHVHLLRSPVIRTLQLARPGPPLHPHPRSPTRSHDYQI